MPIIPNPENILNEQPPQATDLEAAVLGASIIEEEALYLMLENLKAEDFYMGTDSANGKVFLAIQSLFDENKKVNELKIENKLRDMGCFDAIGGHGYLADLSRSVSSSVHTEDYCQIIVNKRKRRDAIEGFRKLLTKSSDPNIAFNDLMSEADQVIFNLINDLGGRNLSGADSYIVNAYEQIKSIQGSKDGITGIGTGTDVDNLTAGWQNGEFIVIAARPSMGKTAFVLEGLKNAANEHGSAGLISLEMSNTGLGKRLLISEAGIDGQRARRGMLKDYEIEKLEEAAARLKSLGLWIDDTTYVNPAKLRAKARAMIHQYDIKILAIDYVQLLQSDKDNREQQVADVSRTCKAIAKEYNIPVIGLSQLNRSCETRIGWKKRPQLADLRESGAIEQDADVVGFLFRPMYYGLKKYPDNINSRWADKGTQNICEVIIGKNRNGPTGMKRIGFDDEQAKFYNLAPEPDDRMRDARKRAAAQKAQFDNLNKNAPF